MAENDEMNLDVEETDNADAEETEEAAENDEPLTDEELERYNVGGRFGWSVQRLTYFYIFSAAFFYAVVCGIWHHDATVNDMNAAVTAGRYGRVFNMSIPMRLCLSDLNINAIGDNGLTPLITAISFKNKDTDRTIGLLLSLGADANEKGKGGVSPLIAALAKNPSKAMIKLLLKKEAAVNEKMAKNLTPLIVAIKKNVNDRIVALLLNAGAEPNVVSTQGEIPLLMAVRRKDANLAAMLLKHGAKPAFEVSKKKGGTVLDEALRSGGERVIETFKPYVDEKLAADALKKHVGDAKYPDDMFVLAANVTDRDALENLYFQSARAGRAKAMIMMKPFVNILAMKNGQMATDVLKQTKSSSKEAKRIERDVKKALTLVKAVGDGKTDGFEKAFAAFDQAKDKSYLLLKVKNEYNLYEFGVAGKAGAELLGRLKNSGLDIETANEEHLKKIAVSGLKNNPHPDVAAMIVEMSAGKLAPSEMIDAAQTNPKTAVFDYVFDLFGRTETNAQRQEQLLDALEKGQKERAEKILSVEENTAFDKPVLAAAVKSKMPVAFLRRLVDLGQSVGYVDKKSGETLLMTAVRGGADLETVKYLVENGSDPKLKNKKNKTAYRIARETKKVDAAVSDYLKSVTPVEKKTQAVQKKTPSAKTKTVGGKK